MNIVIATDRQDLGRRAAALGASGLRSAIADRGHANLIVATGASQFSVLAALILAPDVAWSKVTGFHLDEYLGLPVTHPASFHNYLIICGAPDARKATAVKNAVEGPVTPDCPASILQQHAQTTLLLDPESAALLGHV